jgi:hypothetical protein
MPLSSVQHIHRCVRQTLTKEVTRAVTLDSETHQPEIRLECSLTSVHKNPPRDSFSRAQGVPTKEQAKKTVYQSLCEE